MKALARLLLASVLATPLIAQAPPFTTGLRAPLEPAFTRNGNLIISEAGNGPNTGRISLVDRITGQRRTLVEAMPSGIFNVTPPAPSGPAGLALQGNTLYVTIGNGDSVQPGTAPGSEIPNPNPSSPILSSVLALQPSEPLDAIEGGFLLQRSQHDLLKSGETVTLTNGAGENLAIRLVVDFPNYVAEPRPDEPLNVRLMNTFGVAALGQTLYVVDASQNRINKVDVNTGAYTALTTFAKIANPTPVGPPFIDAVPNSVRLRGGQLLVTLLTGFPFPAGQAQVRTVDLNTGVNELLVTGLTSAIDVLPLGSGPASPMLVAEFSTSQLEGRPGRVRMVAPGASPVLVADGLITPTGIAVDQRSGDIFVTHLGPGIVTRIQAASIVPLSAPNAFIPALASTPGAYGSRFRTSVQLSNPSPYASAGKLVFHPAGAHAAPGDPALSYSLAPFETRFFEDPLASAAADAIVTGDVVSTAGETPTAVVRIFDETSASNASVTMPLIGTANLLVAGSRGALITPDDAEDQRFNIGIRALEDGVAMTMTVYGSNGSALRTRSVVYGPGYFLQSSSLELTGGPVGANQALVFTVDAGTAIVYGSTVENSGRGMTVQIATPVFDQ
jgi:hypothetical protein